MKKINYTNEDKNTIVREYLGGKSIAALAIKYSQDITAFDSQKPRIRRILVENGVRLRRGKRPAGFLPHQMNEKIFELLNLLEQSMISTHQMLRDLRAELTTPGEKRHVRQLEGNA